MQIYEGQVHYRTKKMYWKACLRNKRRSFVSSVPCLCIKTLVIPKGKKKYDSFAVDAGMGEEVKLEC